MRVRALKLSLATEDAVTEEALLSAVSARLQASIASEAVEGGRIHWSSVELIRWSNATPKGPQSEAHKANRLASRARTIARKKQQNGPVAP